MEIFSRLFSLPKEKKILEKLATSVFDEYVHWNKISIFISSKIFKEDIIP